MGSNHGSLVMLAIKNESSDLSAKDAEREDEVAHHFGDEGSWALVDIDRTGFAHHSGQR